MPKNRIVEKKRQIGKRELAYLLRRLGQPADIQSTTETLYAALVNSIEVKRATAAGAPVQIWCRFVPETDEAPVCAECGETLMVHDARKGGGVVWVCTCQLALIDNHLFYIAGHLKKLKTNGAKE